MHPHRSSALGYASAASAAHSRVYGACAAEAAASESSGLSVGGCIRAWRYFGPHPVVAKVERKNTGTESSSLESLVVWNWMAMRSLERACSQESLSWQLAVC